MVDLFTSFLPASLTHLYNDLFFFFFITVRIVLPVLLWDLYGAPGHITLLSPDLPHTYIGPLTHVGPHTLRGPYTHSGPHTLVGPYTHGVLYPYGVVHSEVIVDFVLITVISSLH